MEHEAWPSPQEPSREPLPRVEDLPIAEQGYEQESVKEAFNSFYRHAAQLDAALRTLEAVDSFHRQAAALRADLRQLRAAGWTQQSWTAPQSYGYGMRAPREGIPPAVWRIGGEVVFLVTVAVALGVAKLAWWAIVLAMAAAFVIVCIVEWLATRDQYTLPRATEPAPVLPVVEAQRVEDTAESDSSGWSAFEEAQEPSDAMTIVGAATVREEDVEAESEAAEEEPAPEEPEPEPDEPDLPPAAEVEPEHEPVGGPEGTPERRRWWRRAAAESEPEPEPEQPRHVRVLPSEESDPWEDRFDESTDPEEETDTPDKATVEPDEETEEPALVVDEEPRRRFRRR